MSELQAFPKQEDSLKLRGRIRPVTRINRRILVAGAVLGIAGIFAAFAVALDPPKPAQDTVPERLAISAGKRTPEALQRLPSSYEGVTAPLLGAPTTGDLGGTIVSHERALGIEPDWNVAPDTDFRPSEMEEAIRAQRLAEARLAEAAGKSGVFFDVSSHKAPVPESAGAAASRDPAAELFALASRTSSLPALQDTSGDPNLQSRKIAFAASEGRASDINPHAVTDPLSPYLVMAGSVIPAALLTAINSDLPGMVTAQVTQPVFDTVSGSHLLVPQGARLIGRYQSEISFGQDRALLTWDRIIFPDGSSLRISDPGTDAAGAAGISGRTDHHWSRVFAAAGLATLLSIGSEAANSDDSDVERAILRGFGDSVSRTGDRIVDRNLSIQPTIRVAPGTPVRVLVTRDLVLRPYSMAN